MSNVPEKGASRQGSMRDAPTLPPAASNATGNVLADADRAYARAIESKDPKAIASALWELGRARYELGDLEGANNAFQRAVDVGSNEVSPRALNGLGVVASSRGNSQDARDYFEKAIATGDPEVVPKARRNLGILLWEMGDQAGATAALEQTIQSRHPEQAPKAALNLGDYLKGVDDLEGAMRAYSAGMDFGHPTYSPEAAFLLGLLRRDRGDDDGAKIAFQKAIDFGSSDWSAMATSMLSLLDASNANKVSAEEAVEQLRELQISAEELGWSDSLASIDEAVVVQADELNGPAVVLERFLSSDVFVLGVPAGDLSVPGQGTESDLIHFMDLDKAGKDRLILPVFTQPAVMRKALLRNPEWQSLFVLKVSGRDLYDNVGSDTTIVINPWSRLEFELPGASP